jgi:hypothetical protein
MTVIKSNPKLSEAYSPLIVKLFLPIVRKLPPPTIPYHYVLYILFVKKSVNTSEHHHTIFHAQYHYYFVLCINRGYTISRDRTPYDNCLFSHHNSHKFPLN